MNTVPSSPSSGSERDPRIRRVVEDVLRRRAAGETLSDEQVLAAYPDLLPELREELALLALIQRAGARAEQTRTVATTNTGREEPSSASESTLPRSIQGAFPKGGAAAFAPSSDSFAGYQIVRELHRGGQGVVYQALHKTTKRKVAIKVMKEGPFADAADRARFEREVQILGQLNHPNIVAVHDTGVAAGCHYFVMDYVSGQPLDVYMASKRRSVAETLTLFARICDAVNAAHLGGVIHRDLKPGNIQIDPAGEPHILDFGLAKVAAPLAGTGIPSSSPTATGILSGSPVAVMTQTGHFLGTPAWTSPEQAERRPALIDLRTDVYSLGVILYHMLTSKFPYDVSGDWRDVLDRVRQAVPVRPRSYRREVDDEVETIVLKCLSKERERRYQSAGELARDVRHYLAGEPIEAKRDSALYVLRKTLWRYRLHTGLAAAFVLLIAASAITATVLWQRAAQAEQEQFRQWQRANTERDAALAARAAETEQRKLAEQEKQRAEANEMRAKFNEQEAQTEAAKFKAVNDFVQIDMLRSVDPDKAHGREITIHEILDDTAKQLEEGKLAHNPAVEAEVRHTAGVMYRKLAKFEDAEHHLRRGIKLRKQLVGERDDADLANDLNSLAVLIDARGRSAEALPKHEEALAMQQRLFPGDHPAVATSLDGVAGCLNSLGRAAEALPKHEEALAMRQRLFPGDHPDVALGLSNVAACLQSLGRAAEALLKHEEALAMWQRLFSGDHPAVATSLNNVAGCLQSLGRFAEALSKAEEALAMKQRLFPGDHPAVATSLNNVAACLQSLGRSAEALPKYEEALAMLQRLFPGDHPNVAGSLNNVAICLKSLGRSVEALPKYEEALAMTQRLFPGDHPAVAASLNNVAYCLNSLGRSAAALPKHEEALAMHKRVLPPGHPHILYPQIGLGDALMKLGRFAEAEPLLLDAAAQCERSAAHRRAHWRNVLDTLVQLYDAWHAAEPDQGYNQRAAEWRAKLEQWQASTQPASPALP